MPWTSYHNHSLPGAENVSPKAFVEEAVHLGLHAIGFSANAPLPIVNQWSMDPVQRPGYLREIRALQKKWQNDMDVYCGLEVDFIPGLMGTENKIIENSHLDFTIGSIHYVDSFEDGTYWEFDRDHETFCLGVEKIFKGNVKKAVSRYFELTRWMVMLEPPDILAHFDKVKIHNEGGKLFSESERWYRQEIDRTLKTISTTDVILEVNTRGLYKGRFLDLYPSRWILERIRDLDIPVTLSAEAHHPRELMAGFEYAAGILKDLGFKSLMVLVDGKWQEVGFDKSGLFLHNRGQESIHSMGA